MSLLLRLTIFEFIFHFDKINEFIIQVDKVEEFVGRLGEFDASLKESPTLKAL